MAKPKEKDVVVSTSENEAQVTAVFGNTAKEPNLSPDTELWLGEARALQEQHFENLDQAVSALIDRVLIKMGMSEKPQSELKEFLEGLFSSDPDLQTELKEILRIG